MTHRRRRRMFNPARHNNRSRLSRLQHGFVRYVRGVVRAIDHAFDVLLADGPGVHRAQAISLGVLGAAIVLHIVTAAFRGWTHGS
jgi:hypothetical protein